MGFVLVFVIILALVFGPQWWAQYTFRRYAKPLPNLKGTGSELARHLLDRFDMQDVNVEKGEPGTDHYDPEKRLVCLSPDNHDNKSLTAIAVAAHEVGHAIQHHRNEPLLAWRTRLVIFANAVQKFGVSVFVVMPIVTAITRAPALAGLMALVGLATMLMATLVHLITLPVETDASFNKALPILEAGYVEKKDIPKVKRILRAAALTYLASSLASLLNLWRWAAILRR